MAVLNALEPGTYTDPTDFMKLYNTTVYTADGEKSVQLGDIIKKYERIVICAEGEQNKSCQNIDKSNVLILVDDNCINYRGYGDNFKEKSNLYFLKK